MIYVAHGNEARRAIVEANLNLLTHDVQLSTDAPAVMLRRCQETPPDCAVVGSDFPGEDYFELLNNLSQLNCCPIVAVLKREDLDRSERLLQDRVLGVLVEPIDESDLRTSIYLARRRFDQAQVMQARILELRQQLDSGHSDKAAQS